MLDAALAVFAERGYEQARLEEIAERAEFGKGTLYNYFDGGKHEILFAIFERVHGELRRLVERYFADEERRGRPVRAVYRDFLRALIGHLTENRSTFLVIMKEAHRTMLDADRTSAERLMALHESVADVLIPVLEASMAQGAMRPLPVRMVTHLLFGTVFDYLMHGAADGFCGGFEAAGLPSPDDAADFLAAVLFDGLLPQPDAPFSLTSP